MSVCVGLDGCVMAVPAYLSMANHQPVKQYHADLLTFGDVRVFDIEKIYEYYHLNERQVKTVEWIRENLLKYYAARKSVDIALLKGSISIHRLGLVPGSELLIVSALVFRLDAPHMKLLETRHIQIGKFGGRRLINPKFQRNWITGEWVLKVDCKNE